MSESYIDRMKKYSGIELKEDEEDKKQTYKAILIKEQEKKGLIAKIARNIAKKMGNDKLYKVVIEEEDDIQPIAIVAANNEKEAISKIK